MNGIITNACAHPPDALTHIGISYTDDLKQAKISD